MKNVITPKDLSEHFSLDITKKKIKVKTDGLSIAHNQDGALYALYSGIVAPGRPDTTNKYDNYPNGVTFNSTDGAGVGAWQWVKTQTGWQISNGDTGWINLNANRLIKGPNESPTLKGGDILVRRQNNTVSIWFKNVVLPNGAKAIQAQAFRNLAETNKGIPVGFRISNQKNQDNYSSTRQNFCTGGGEMGISLISVYGGANQEHGGMAYIGYATFGKVLQPVNDLGDITFNLIVSEYTTNDQFPLTISV